MYVWYMDAAREGPDSTKAQRKRKLSAEKPDSPMQTRAVQTRGGLLKAARLIFARDGFEAAKLQDIASTAGKTRGALYDHFKDKEDLFFALIAEDLAKDSDVYREKLNPTSSRGDRIRVFTQQLEAFIHDRQRALLYIEFKMYAARHPNSRPRLAEVHLAMCYQSSASKLELIPELVVTDAFDRRRVAASFGALLDGLALNHYFDPLGMTKEEIHKRVDNFVRERFRKNNRASPAE